MESISEVTAEEAHRKPIDFSVESWRVKVTLDNGNIHIRADSDLVCHMLEAEVMEKDLSEQDRLLLGDIDTVYSVMEECVAKGRHI